ncbi:lipopolysaccharide biosynthesis protein [Halorubrum ezzemoulense]|uniref:lipopolysaccharide biosynthesis protein n=1 Tax=Halorubrum ezzemoulense TaxID=337243 RepID=UPI00142E7FA6|nr:polysaccharide biosynthesis C-terminal domain-containing protein [Halorubrum ezzemoulense]
MTTVKGIIMIPIITNLLGADSYGIWSTLLAFVVLFSTTGSVHLDGALIRFSTNQNKEQTYSDILIITLILASSISSLVFILGIVFEPNTLFNGSNNINSNFELTIVTALLIFSEIIYRVNVNFPRALGEVKLYELIRSGRAILEIIFVSIIFIYGRNIILGLLSIISILIFIDVLIIIYALLKYDLPPPELRNFSKYIRYGVPMVPNAISNELIKSADKYMILYLISPTAVGIYSVAYSICSSLTKFSTILNPTLYPTVSKEWDDGNIIELKRLYKTVFRYYIIISVPAFFGLTILSQEVITVFSTGEIAQRANTIVPILAFGFLIRGLDNPLEYILTSSKKTGHIAKATGLSAISNLLLNFVFIKIFGILGAAFASTLSHIIAFYLIYKYSHRQFKFDIPVETVFQSIFSGSIMVIGLYLIPFEFSPIISTVILPPVGAIIYFVFLYIIGGVNRQDINYIVTHIS